MLYLIGQISLLLLATATLFFGLGVLFSRRFLMRLEAKKSAEPDGATPPDQDAQRAVLQGLHGKIEDQSKRIEALLRAHADLQAVLEQTTRERDALQVAAAQQAEKDTRLANARVDLDEGRSALGSER